MVHVDKKIEIMANWFYPTQLMNRHTMYIVQEVREDSLSDPDSILLGIDKQILLHGYGYPEMSIQKR